jgi:predicted amidohydrolase
MRSSSGSASCTPAPAERRGAAAGGYSPQVPNAFTVAAVQLAPDPDRAAALAAADRLVREAAARGARLVLLPELWPHLASYREMRDGAEPLDGPIVGWARSIAAELAIELVAGSFSELDADGKVYNSSLHLSPGGRIQARYRKIHMFDVAVGGVSYRESDATAAGSEIVVSRTEDGVELGMSICYDLRFPELYRLLALAGARVLLVPSAFIAATVADHWEPLLRARAIESQAFVIAANQIGDYAPGRRCGGRSMIIDPWGIVLAQAQDAPGVIVADLDLARLAQIRDNLPSLANRRPDVYATPVAGNSEWVAGNGSEAVLGSADLID